MNHSVLAPSYADAVRLSNAVAEYGWHSRIVSRNGHTAVLVYAPLSVMKAACKRASFEPGRSLA